MAGEVEHFSISQINMFFRCPEQYRRRYMCGEKRPPGVAAHVGRGVHGAIEHDLQQKIVTRENIPKKDLAELAAEKYDEGLRQEGVFIKREETSEAKRLLGEGKDNAVDSVVAWHDTLAERIMPRLVERKVKMIEPRLEIPLLGVIDIVDENMALREWKTGGPRSKWNQQRVDHSIQFTLYDKMVQLTTGSPPSSMLTSVVKYGLKNDGKTKKRSMSELLINDIANMQQCILCSSGNYCKVEEFKTTRHQSDYDALVERILHMQQRVFAGMFGPTDTESWMCSPDWCGYWWSCKYIPEHRRRLPNV